MAQKDAEVPECCQKTESAVIDEGMDTDDVGKPEESIALVELPPVSDRRERERTEDMKQSRSSIVLVLACAFGFLAFVVHRRKD